MAKRSGAHRFSKTMKRKALKRAGGCCTVCHTKGDLKWNPLEPHHIVPVSQGGETTMENLQIVCRECHVKIHQEMEVSS